MTWPNRSESDGSSYTNRPSSDTGELLWSASVYPWQLPTPWMYSFSSWINRIINL